jgi:hypothetical protein
MNRPIAAQPRTALSANLRAITERRTSNARRAGNPSEVPLQQRRKAAPAPSLKAD